MKRRWLAILAGVIPLGFVIWLATRHHSTPMPIPSPDSGIARTETPEASAPVAIAPDAATEPLWKPSGKACRLSIAPGTRFDRVSSTMLAALLVEGFDPKTQRFAMRHAVHPDAGDPDPNWGEWFARDCKGDRIEYDHPLTETEQAKPSAVLADPQGADDGGASGRVRIDRFDIRGSRMAVYATIATQYGYYFSCRGFQAIVRLDEDELVVEGIGAADLYGCDENGNDLRLAPLGGQTALLLPVSAGTGEDGDAASEWWAYVPDRGGLRFVGAIARWKSAGNGTVGTGRWFGSMDATLVDAGGLEVEEAWKFERYNTDGTTTPGATKNVHRTYTLVDGGLVKSPSANPTR